MTISHLRHRRAVAARRRGAFGGVPSVRLIPPVAEPPKDRARSLLEPALGGGYPARTQSACKLGGAAPARGSFIVAARHETASLLL